MVDFENKVRYDVNDLKRIIEILRAPGGCPWDYEQTHESIRRNLLEEAAEAAEAIDKKDPENLKEELGDVLMQVVFHADIEEKNGSFNLEDVADTACRKLINRHPHVFGTGEAKDSGEVIANWDAIKRKEKNQETVTETLRAVARSLPGLWRAEKIQNKAAKAGYNQQSADTALESAAKVLTKLKSPECRGEELEEQVGDLFFTAVGVARSYRIDPEEALAKACERFIEAFEESERKTKK